jgi:hypothetical protein
MTAKDYGLPTTLIQDSNASGRSQITVCWGDCKGERKKQNEVKIRQQGGNILFDDGGIPLRCEMSFVVVYSEIFF